MIDIFEANLELIKLFSIKKEHSAQKMGSGQVEVLSTPSMICFMEQTALESVQSKLPNGFISVGIKIDIKHLKPVPIGANLKVSTKLLEAKDRWLKFKVKATWKNMNIGQGVHERLIINKDVFLQKIEEKQKI